MIRAKLAHGVPSLIAIELPFRTEIMRTHDLYLTNDVSKQFNQYLNTAGFVWRLFLKEKSYNSSEEYNIVKAYYYSKDKKILDLDIVFI